MPHSAVISLRVSTDEQAIEGYSLAAQERACRAYCEMQGWTVVGVFVDEGISGTLPPAARPGLAAALGLLRSGQAQALVVHKLDRLARSVRIANDLVDEFQRRGIAFVAVADHLDLSTPFGWAAFQMQNVWNELYIKNLSFETKKGHREKAAKGLWVGPVPYGYRRAGKSLAPSDATAPTATGDVAAAVALLFERYATGLHSDDSLAELMNTEGWRTLNWQTGQWGLFGRESVRAILINRAYLGYVSAGGIEFPGQHPPLVELATFQRVQAIRAERAGQHGPFKARPADGEMLTGRVWCAACGSRMHRNWSGRATSRTARYRCSGPRAAGERHRVCDEPTALSETIEQAVLQVLSRLRVTPELRAWLDAEARAAAATTAPVADQTAIMSRLNRLGEVYADGLINKAKYHEQRDALLAQLAAETQAPQDLSLDAILEMLDDIPYLLQQATREEARGIIAPLLSHVWVRGKTLHAITPTAAFEPLLVGVWRTEVVRGCLTGFRHHLTTSAVSLWRSDRTLLIAA